MLQISASDNRVEQASARIAPHCSVDLDDLIN